MPRPKSSQIILFGISSLIVIAAAAALAFSWPRAHAAFLDASHAEATNLIAEAVTASPPEAAVDYRLATWLNPEAQAGYLGLARIQIAAGNAETALTALNRAGEGSEAAELRTRTLIELGRIDEAATRAHSMAAPGRTDADIILAALTYALAGRTSDIAALIPLVSSPQAATRLARIQAGDLPLAGELYADGLPESSRSLLLKLPTSFEHNLLLAHIYYDQHTATGLATATDYLTSATALNPGNLEAHQFLATVYAERGLIAESSAQALLAQRLAAGRP